MERFFGIFGILAILFIAYLLSNNKSRINWYTIFSGLALQLALALFILKTTIGQKIFHAIGVGIDRLLVFSDAGGDFVFGALTKMNLLHHEVFGDYGAYLFALKLIPTIIFIAILVNIAYHLGLMQRIVSFIAKIVYKIMRVSGSEALSNVSSAFVGQVEAQLMIKPYVPTMTNSELLASMTGSMACIAGGVMAVYIGMGVPAEYLLTASIMAAPGALVISKLVYPETKKSETRGSIELDVKQNYVNLLDAIAQGASEGMKISINVIAMLIGFIALIAMINAILGKFGLFVFHYTGIEHILGMDMQAFSLKSILGTVFSIFAFLMGVPFAEASQVGGLMGTKLVINEFVAYTDLLPMIKAGQLSPRSIVIATFALCGFANFGSIAIQVGGIGEIAPNRKEDLARLGLKALICGTLASYMSATIAGIIF
ncbi:MAG: nucleoside transporter C-terminal domain-containing protein [Candidatus Gastranaerophilales bacterium]|nr:nucleoside transporter C-terminal domain-containing protein [Candidatus Gastranaerophilales bacterium]